MPAYRLALERSEPSAGCRARVLQVSEFGDVVVLDVTVPGDNLDCAVS